MCVRVGQTQAYPGTLSSGQGQVYGVGSLTDGPQFEPLSASGGKYALVPLPLLAPSPSKPPPPPKWNADPKSVSLVEAP